jgi:serine/threonine protein kinase
VKWSNALYTIQECCLVKDLRPLTKYRFRVSCINTVGISSYSWASEEITTLAPGESKISIDNTQVQKLLRNQYNLEKRSQNLVLVRKLSDDLKDVNYKRSDDEIFKIQANHDPSDLYSIESKVYQFGDICLNNIIDNANQTKKLLKYTSKLNDNEIKILRELREQDRLIQLIEGFQFTNKENNKITFALVYAHAVPVIEFISHKHKYSEELVVKILRQLLDAIQWIHLHGFVHLNIHPLTVLNANYTQVNIKLSGFENSVQLSEFNRDIDILPAIQEEGACNLPLAYGNASLPLEFSSPELLNKEKLGMATDIWSVGVLAALL